MKRSPIEVCTSNSKILGGFDNARWIGEAIESGSALDDLTHDLPAEAYDLIDRIARVHVLGR
jgi:hypothetical protein